MTPESEKTPAGVAALTGSVVIGKMLEGNRDRSQAATASHSGEPQSLQTVHGFPRMQTLQRGP